MTTVPWPEIMNTTAPALRQTPLVSRHLALGARMVDFGGWEMPIHYGSQLEEHHAVRKEAGMFDVSHMCVVDAQGGGVRGFLRAVLANNVDKLQVSGKALYTCIPNSPGRILDDPNVYYLDGSAFRLIGNAAAAQKDLEGLEQPIRRLGADVPLTPPPYGRRRGRRCAPG